MMFVFRTGPFAPPALPVELSAFRAATEVGFISIPSGWLGGWHQPPADGYIFVLSGEIQIEVGNGEVPRRMMANALPMRSNKALQLTANPLRGLSAAELGR
jgi:hypothetical protein